jgi:hypothetical protein
MSQPGDGINFESANRDALNVTVKRSQFHNNNWGVWADGKFVLANDSNTFIDNGINVEGGGDIYFGDEGSQQVQLYSICVEEPIKETGESNQIEFRLHNNLLPLPFTSGIIAVPSVHEELPASLPESKTLVVGASIKLMRDEVEVPFATGGVPAYFDIPDGMEPPFTVLMWSGFAWVEIPSQVVNGEVVFAVTRHVCAGAIGF